MKGLEDELRPWTCSVDRRIALRGWEDPNPSKPLVHFLHGNGFSGLSYAPFLSELHPGYALFIQDLLGHGDSDAGESFPGWGGMADHALGVLACRASEWEGRELLGVGHSLGAVISILIAARRPDLFDRLVLMDPVLFSPGMLLGSRVAGALGLLRFHPLARRTRARKATFETRAQARASLEGRGVFKGWTEESLESYLAHGLKEEGDGVALKCPTWLEAEIFASVPQGLWRALRDLRCPTHIIVGEATHSFIRASVRRAARINPVITFEETPGGHCFMQERPEKAAAMVSGFLSGEVR